METMISRPNVRHGWLGRPCSKRARLGAAGPENRRPAPAETEESGQAASPCADNALALWLESSQGREQSPLFSPETTAHPRAVDHRSEQYLRPGLYYCF